MRILVITGLTGWGIGGVQSETVALCCGLETAGVTMALVVDRLSASLGDVRQYPIEYPPRQNAARQVRHAIEDFSPDVVHVVGGGIGLLTDIETMNPPCPWLFTAHNLPPFERILHRMHAVEWVHYLARDLKAMPSILKWKSFLRRSGFARVVAHSDAVAASLRRYGCGGEKIAMVPLGTHAENHGDNARRDSAIPSGDRPVNIVTVSGLAHHKGIHTFLQAFVGLSREFPSAIYHIIGQRRDESYMQFLSAYIESAGLKDRVQIHHSASAEQRDRLLDEADLYVQPSHEEGFCLAMIEAAGRVPRLLGTRSGAIEQMLAGDPAATVVDVRSSQQLADSAAVLLRTAVDATVLPARRERLRSLFTWDQYLQSHLRLYESLSRECETAMV